MQIFPSSCASPSSPGLLLLKDTEALLFGFQSIAETIDMNYSDVIPGLIGLIPRINISNIMLADTVMYTIGTHAVLIYLPFTLTFHDSCPLICFLCLLRIPGWVACWPPCDAGWHITHGAPRPCKGRAVCVQCVYSEEDLQGVQTWPRPLCSGHPDCVTGQTCDHRTHHVYH